jgi:hypothetical protein
MTGLRSVGGNTVAEAYYQQMGWCVVATSRVVSAIGFGLIALSLGLGTLLMKKG